jgi:hypothetical protein
MEQSTLSFGILPKKAYERKEEQAFDKKKIGALPRPSDFLKGENVMKRRLILGAVSVLVMLAALAVPQPTPAYAGETVVEATVTFSIYNQPCAAEGGCTDLGTWPAGTYNGNTDPAYPGWVHIRNANGDAPWAVKSQMTKPADTSTGSSSTVRHGTDTINGLGGSVEFDDNNGEHWRVTLDSWGGTAPSVTVSRGSIWWNYKTLIATPDSSSIRAFRPPWGGGMSCNWYRYESVDHYSCSVTH